MFINGPLLFDVQSKFDYGGPIFSGRAFILIFGNFICPRMRMYNINDVIQFHLFHVVVL